MGDEERFEACPSEAVRTRSTLQPLTTQPCDAVKVPLQLPHVPRDAVIGIVPLHLRCQAVVLLEDRLMSVVPTPFLHLKQRASKPALRRHLPHHGLSIL